MNTIQDMKWFEITDEAKNQMDKLLSKNPDKYAVKLEVKGGGCAGFKYEWGFVDSKEQINEDDHVEDWHTGRFVVDESSMLEPAPFPNTVVEPSPWNLSIVIVFCLDASEILYQALPLYT